MIKVKMLTHIAGKPSYVAGQVIDLEDRIARAWIEDGLATPYRDAPPLERAVKVP